MRRIAPIVAVLSGFLLVFINGGSAAATSPGQVFASSCQNGDAGPYDEVKTMNYKGQSIRLLCGTPGGKGVLHIVGGSNPHPIPPQDDEVFEQCLDVIFRPGNQVEVESNATNTAVKKTRISGKTATAAWENESHEIITVYTSDGAQSNNWKGCAEG